MNRSILLAGMAFACLGAGPAGARQAPVRILPIGDSLTQSSPGYRGPLYRLLSDAGYRVEFVGSKTDEPAIPGSTGHEGHGGFTIGPGKSKADAWSDGKGNISDNVDAWLRPKPDYVLLLIGTNDFFNIGDLQPGYEPERDGPARLAALLDKIHAASPSTKILVSSIMPVEWDEKFARRFNGAIPGLVASRPFSSFVDLNRTTGFRAGDWSPDKLHPTPQGYQKMAQGWFEALKAELKASK